MKLLPCIFLIFAIAFTTTIAAQSHTVVFSNLNKKKVKLYIGWYNNATDFRKENKAIFRKIVEVNGTDNAAVVFENVLPGIYAVAVFFDINGNGKMDTNFLGIPKEKYGFSNNVCPLMRAASFKEAAFTVTDKSTSSTIRLK
jgi:uncharacterized protein (DUF2141 family)